MKRDFLKGLGIEDSGIIDRIIDENDADLERERSKYGDYDTVKRDLETARNKLKGFDGVDIAKLTAERDDYKAKYEAAEADKNKELDGLRLDHAIDSALIKAGARSSKAVRALLDTASIKLEDGKITGLDEQVKQLKTESAYLFEDGAGKSMPRFAGKSSGGGTGSITKEDFAKMGYRERLAIKQSNPETYKALTE